MQTIYIDVLIVLNIYVNYFLIKATGKITHTRVKFSRCIIASLYGSLFSLLFLIPQLDQLLNIIIKLFAGATIIPIAFGFHGKITYIFNCISFLGVNFVFAGAIYAVYSWLKPDFMHFNNSTFYIDFSLLLLIVCTAVLYLFLCAIRFFTDKTPETENCYKIIIRYKDKIVSFKGLADTGNSLVDFFSGNPVIICGSDRMSDVTGLEAFSSDWQNIPKGFRLIPYSTISSDSMVPVFRPDEIIIYNARSGSRKSVEAMIGFAAENPYAIFNPKLLRI